MKIDCTTCQFRDLACADCAVSVLLPRRPGPMRHGRAAHLSVARSAAEPLVLSSEEVAAMANLAAAGLIPPLRMTASADPSEKIEELVLLRQRSTAGTNRNRRPQRRSDHLGSAPQWGEPDIA